MTFDLLHLWGEMGLLNRVVTIGLIIMGLATLTVFFERLFVLTRTRRHSRELAQEVTPLLECGDFTGAAAVAGNAPKSHLAAMVSQVVAAYLADIDGRLTRLDRARYETQRYLESFGKEVRRGMPVIASVGSIAPFVGLLGTVVGIIVAFQGIAATGGGGLTAVAGGISEALIETALGLCVAIPAVLLYNFLATRMDQFQHSIMQSAMRLLELLEDRDRARHAA